MHCRALSSHTKHPYCRGTDDAESEDDEEEDDEDQLLCDDDELPRKRMLI